MLCICMGLLQPAFGDRLDAHVAAATTAGFPARSGISERGGHYPTCFWRLFHVGALAIGLLRLEAV
jgi:hypothetical protein